MNKIKNNEFLLLIGDKLEKNHVEETIINGGGKIARSLTSKLIIIADKSHEGVVDKEKYSLWSLSYFTEIVANNKRKREDDSAEKHKSSRLSCEEQYCDKELIVQTSNSITLNKLEYKQWTTAQVTSILLASESDGGAGLSLTELIPFVVAKINGTTLGNIVNYIHVKGDTIAVQQLFDSYSRVSVATKTCKSIVSWVLQQIMTRIYNFWLIEPVSELIKERLIFEAGLSAKAVSELDRSALLDIITRGIIDNNTKTFYNDVLIWLTKFLQDTKVTVPEWRLTTARDWYRSAPAELIRARTDSAYDYLRNLTDPKKLEDLENLIGSNIALPNLGLVPKEYDPHIPYLLTQQRFDILKKVVLKENEGYVLSGPYGVSKSYTMYLIAVYAFVNSIPLLYVPKCGEWVDKYNKNEEESANHYLLELCFYWNSDIFSDNEMEQVIHSGDVVSYLAEYIANDKVVLLLFDDHNELFKKDNNGRQYTDLPYFRNFTKWTSITDGLNTITIYCGSAHSTFENRLPGGSTDKLISIVPPTKNEFTTLIADFKMSHVPIGQICSVTGRMPKELQLFALHMKEYTTDTEIKQQIRIFMEERQHKFNERLELFKEKDLKDVILTLHNLFMYRQQGYVDISGPFWDQGLLYRDKDGTLTPISDPANQALWSFYCQNIVKDN